MFQRSGLLLCTLLLVQPQAHAQTAATPRQLIERLGVEIRQILENPKSTRTSDDAERAVAEQVAAWAGGAGDAAALTERDALGGTPLMLAVSGAYPRVVKALLAAPGVRLNINDTNAAGETAWMVAKTAPSMTLVACQPGALTLERYPLLQPYLRRMADLMKGHTAAAASIIQALRDAGAEANTDAARRAWLARCPNAAAELRSALDRDDLLATLVNHALERQVAFNHAYREGLTTLSQKPPTDMKFIPVGNGLPLPVPGKSLNCRKMPPPALRGSLNWMGTLLFRAEVATRAGVVEAADFTVLSDPAPASYVVDHFRGALIRALAGYQCEGDHVFAQEFQIKVQ